MRRLAPWRAATLRLCAVTSLFACGCRKEAPRQASGAQVTVIARGLTVPWSIAVSPDGRLFVTERAGRIRVISHDTLAETPWAAIPAFDATGQRWETGLMGLALHPDFIKTPYVYVCYTAGENESNMVNRVARLREQGGRGTELTILLDGIPAGRYHNGCRVKVGPDRKLYITTGDAYRRMPAQDRSSLAGKVLRIELDGSIPTDNPFPGSPVWTLGHRNPQGITWDPQSGSGIVSEHGDAVDEINVLERGANYGWPLVTGFSSDTAYKNAALVFHFAPAGLTFVPDSVFGGDHSMLLATLNGRRLLRLSVNGKNVVVIDNAALSGYGRLRDVADAGDGSVYVLTSNRDGRGDPARDDDRVLRVRFTPKAAVSKSDALSRSRPLDGQQASRP